MVGVLYICTGKYTIFWKDFYNSAERFFLPAQQKTYFVFTDAEEIYGEENSNVQKNYQKNLGWPYDTLFRFEMFSSIKSQLQVCEYLFFLNANIILLDYIHNDILPCEINDGLVGVMHPYYWDKSVNIFPYERNPKSTAYIQHGDGRHYFFGAFNGGKSTAYLKLIDTLKNNIRKDLQNNIIAVWHDESQLNHYLLHKNPIVLPPSYSYPEDYTLPYKPILSILDKTKHGGHAYLRGETNTKI